MSRSRAPAASLASRTIAFWMGVALFASLALFGGASRADALNQPIVRILSIIISAILLLSMTQAQLQRARQLMMLLGLFAFLCVLQLVPLPPGLWAQLPGHGSIAAALHDVGQFGSWRPWSLAPDRTVNALLACSTIFATLLVLSLQERRSLESTIPIVLLVFLGISGMVGLSQIYGSGPYFYRITNDGNAVGFFANRNHFAFFLAMGFPLLAHLAVQSSQRASKLAIQLTCGAIAIVLVALLITNGSRGGIVLGIVGLIGGGAQIVLSSDRRILPKEAIITGAVLLLVLVILAALFWYTGRGLSFSRLAESSDTEGEMRWLALPTIVEMVRSYFPLGAGLGAFESAYKLVERDELVSGTYLNHVHNDYLELAIDAGIIGWALLGWLVVVLIGHARRKLSSSQYRSATLMAVVVVVQFAIGSALDYPLRTAFMSALFSYAAFLIMRPIDDSATNTRLGPAGAER